MKWRMGLLIMFLLAFLIDTDETKASSKHDIVEPVQTYTYEEMVADIKQLQATYPEVVRYKVIGQSEYGRNIYAVGLGNGKESVYIDGSHHAREWLTTNLNMYMINKYAQFYQLHYNLDQYNVRDTLNKTTIWFVPMVNPDGVTLQQKGLSAFPQSSHAYLTQINDGSTNFKRWKANAKGVDLNRQYDADWENIKYNTGRPAYKNYKGTAPEQARETKAVVNFVRSIDPEIAITYHTAGKIIYWNFHQDEYFSRDQSYALQLNSMTGYSLVQPTPNPSGGGLSDWFVVAFDRPGFTVEIGNYPGETNVPISEFNQTWKENRLLGLYIAQQGYKLSQQGSENKHVEVSVNINGEEMNFDQPAVLMNYRTMVPVRGVFEKVGASLTWNNTTKTAVIKKDDTVVSMTVGKSTATVNGETKTLDAPATIINSRTMIPLRFVGESIGATIKWDSASRTAYISTSDQAEEPETPEEPKEEPTSNEETIVSLMMDDQLMSIQPEARIQDGTTMAPLTDLLKNHNAHYEWQEKSLHVTFEGHEMTVTKDSKQAVVNGETITLPTNVSIIEGNTMIPVSLISPLLQWDLTWDGPNKTLVINTLSNETKAPSPAAEGTDTAEESVTETNSEDSSMEEQPEAQPETTEQKIEQSSTSTEETAPEEEQVDQETQNAPAEGMKDSDLDEAEDSNPVE
ncbi:stalk domain-containing protein [Rossellomorea aquimaris]|uniref:stalk domain-containing protein n=1 Tax=Rossellomorea aquimaris TaxID=189382 RepID=UPI001CFF456E|nr:stalk domain-containing protein [Rossellomorea aquimaris]